jgi:hypothetical protein
MIRLLLILGCCMAICPGFACRSPGPEDSNVEQATELLQDTLDKWKAGASLDSLRDTDPPVYVAEELWHAGTRLNDYRLLGQGEQFGTNIRFQVQLFPASNGRAGKERIVHYLVTTTPARTIAREDR